LRLLLRFATATLRAIIDRAAIERDVPKSLFGQRAAPVPSAGITLSPDHHLRGLSARLASALGYQAGHTVQRRIAMNRRSILSLSATAVFGLALATDSVTAQTKTLKEQLLGTWTLVSFDSFDASGAKVPNMEGSDLKGLVIFTDNGRMSVQYITDYPKIASKDRMKTTPAEDKAVAHGVLSYFGTYTINEADKTISYRIERSSFPNQVTGTDAKRVVTLTGDELKLDNPGRTAGGRTVIVLRRAK
jgi:Lipocalin-like domain